MDLKTAVEGLIFHGGILMTKERKTLKLYVSLG